MGEGYEAEVPLKVCIEAEDYILEVEGRADGIFYMTEEMLAEIRAEENRYDQLTLGFEEPEEHFASIGTTEQTGNMYYIDEIKGIYRNVRAMENPVYVHKAQAMCYAYIYALQHGLEHIGVQMTYCNLDNEEIRYFREEYTWEALNQWFSELIVQYRKWADFQIQWKKKRQASIAYQRCLPHDHPAEEFVFAGAYRRGEDDLHDFSGGESCGGGEGRPHFLPHGQDDYSCGGEGDLRPFAGAWVCGENHSADGKGKAVHV